MQFSPGLADDLLHGLSNVKKKGRMFRTLLSLLVGIVKTAISSSRETTDSSWGKNSNFSQKLLNLIQGFAELRLMAADSSAHKNIISIVTNFGTFLSFSYQNWCKLSGLNIYKRCCQSAKNCHWRDYRAGGKSFDREQMASVLYVPMWSKRRMLMRALLS